MQDVHRIDLLQRPPMALAHEEVHDNRTGEATRREDVSVAVVNGPRDVRSEEGNEKIPHPIGAGCEGHALCSVARWVDLADYGPYDWAPGHGEAGDEEAREYDHGVSDAGAVLRIDRVESEVAEGCKNHEAHEHPEPTGYERRTSAKLFDNVQAGECASEVDGAEDNRRDVGVGQTDRLEDGCAVVEVEVGSGELLQSLERDPQDGSIGHAWAGEDLVPRVFASTSAFSVELAFDLPDFSLDFGMVFRDAVADRDRLAGVLDSALAVSPTG